MTIYKILTLSICFYAQLNFCFAQENTKTNTTDRKNIIKTSLSSPFFHGYSLAYERFFNANTSFQISGIWRYYKDKYSPDIQDTNIEIFPEIRFYAERKYGSGVFVAPYLGYYRYLGKTVNTPDTYSLGAIVGGQWFIKKIISMDIWLGLGYQNNFTGDYNASHSHYRNGISGRAGITLGVAF